MTSLFDLKECPDVCLPPPPPRISRKRSRGFTLAEILIALGLLGVIAAFTIPKILVAVNTSQRDAIFKRDFSAINEVLQLMVLNDVFSQSAAAQNAYFYDKLNLVKICTSVSAFTGGCWTQSSDYAMFDTYKTLVSGGILPSGSSLMTAFVDTVADAQGDRVSYLLYDYNGVNSPNIAGQDQCVLIYGRGPNAYDPPSWGAFWGGVPIKPGQLTTGDNSTWTCRDLVRSVFSS